MKTSKMSWIGGALVATLVGLGQLATADKPKAAAPELTADAIVEKHLAALGGAELLRATKSVQYTVTGEKAGKKFTKSVKYARPGKMRVDFATDEMSGSKAFDGKVAWVKKGAEAAVAMTAEDTAGMRVHADFDPPFLDAAKRGISIKLAGKSEVAGTPAYDFEVTSASGEIEHHFIDAATFLTLRETWSMKKDGKVITGSVRLGDYRKVQGRMVNHSMEFESEGSAGKSVVSQVAYDKAIDPSVFAMPRK